MNLKQPRSSLEEVRAHILEDLDEAIKYLPVEHAASEYGRATKGAAYALRGKVYLYDKEWQSSITSPITMVMISMTITPVFSNSITGRKVRKQYSRSRIRVVLALNMVCRYKL